MKTYQSICNDLGVTNLLDANLWGADLCSANLRGADLHGADLRGVNLWSANLRCANLQGANLQDVNLRGADLWNANLRGADLRDANLRCADLRDANLRCANLHSADLRGADLSQTKGIIYASVSFHNHGECGRQLTGVLINGGKRFFCGCFTGSESDILQYIETNRPEFRETRMGAFEFVNKQITNK